MDTETFFAEMRAAPRPVIVDFWAPWCGPCKITKPMLEKLAAQYQGQVDLREINVDENGDVARSLGIMGIPTLVVYRGGDEVTRIVGVKSAESYAQLFTDLSTGQAEIQVHLNSRERWMRLGGAALLAAMAFYVREWWILIPAALLGFLGIYDRCPIWKAVTGYFKRGRAKSPAA